MIRYIYILLLLFSCGQKSELKFSNAGNNQESLVQELSSDVGVRRFDQLFFNLKAIFPFSEEDSFWNSLVSKYHSQKINLPANNNVDNFSATTQIAYINLVSEFCFRATNQSAQSERIWDPDIIRLDGAPVTQLNEESIEYFIQRSIEQFWPEKMRSDEVLVNQSMTHLMTLSDELLADLPLNVSSTTKSWSLGMCVAIVANASTMLMP